MTKTSRLGLYADVRAVLDAALEHGGGTFTCESYGKAVHWRQRAYRFRVALENKLGPKASAPYDAIVIPRIPEGSCDVVITLHKVIGGVFTPANDRLAPVNEDELLAEAEALARRLEGQA